MKKIAVPVVTLALCFFAVKYAASWYFNDFQDANGTTYANVLKMLRTHPQDQRLRDEVLTRMEDNKLTSNEYASLKELYFLEHGTFEGVPAGTNTEIAFLESKKALAEFFVFKGKVHCTTKDKTRTVMYDTADNMRYGKFAPKENDNAVVYQTTRWHYSYIRASSSMAMS